MQRTCSLDYLGVPRQPLFQQCWFLSGISRPGFHRGGQKAPEGACGRPRVRQAVRQGDEQQFRRAIGFAGAVFAAGRTRGGLATETSGLDKKNSHFDELWCAGYIGCYCSYFYMLGVGCRFGASPIVYRYDDWSNTAPLQMVEFYLILFACHLNIGLFGFGSL